jgi:hypothetical protein
MKAYPYDISYGVTTDGLVYSFKRKKYLKPADNGKGYLFVQLRGKTIYVHRMVAITYLGDPSGMQVNHKDKNKKNNSVSNLEWVTGSDNLYHYYGKTPQEKINTLLNAGVSIESAIYSLT